MWAGCPIHKASHSAVNPNRDENIPINPASISHIHMSLSDYLKKKKTKIVTLLHYHNSILQPLQLSVLLSCGLAERQS